MTFLVLVLLMCERKHFAIKKTERKILYLIFVYVFFDRFCHIEFVVSIAKKMVYVVLHYEIQNWVRIF